MVRDRISRQCSAALNLMPAGRAENQYQTKAVFKTQNYT